MAELDLTDIDSETEDFDSYLDQTDELVEAFTADDDRRRANAHYVFRKLVERHPDVVEDHLDDLLSFAEESPPDEEKYTITQAIESFFAESRSVPSFENANIDPSELRRRTKVPQEKVEAVEPFLPYFKEYATPASDWVPGLDGPPHRQGVLCIWILLGDNGVELPKEVVQNGWLCFVNGRHAFHNYVGLGVLRVAAQQGGDYSTVAVGALVDKGIHTGLLGNNISNDVTVEDFTVEVVERLVADSSVSVRGLTFDEYRESFYELSDGCDALDPDRHWPHGEVSSLRWKVREKVGAGMFDI